MSDQTPPLRLAFLHGGSLDGEQRWLSGDWPDRYHLIPTGEVWVHVGSGNYTLSGNIGGNDG